MPTIRNALEIEAPDDQLFALAQDYDLRLEWDPFLREMRFLDGATEAAEGVRVWVRAYNGLTMEVRYVTVDPPERVAMTMLEGPPMFSKFAGTWFFEALGPKCTEVTFQYHYVLWPRWLSPVGEPVASRILKRDMRKRLEGLKESAETTDILDELDVS